MRVTITGATGLIGGAVINSLTRTGAEVTVLSRDPAKARRRLADLPVEAVSWSPMEEPAPAEALSGADAVIHLAGEPIAQRWSGEVKRLIRETRVRGTANLITGLGQARPAPSVLVSSSAVGIYGPRADEPLDEDSPLGEGFLAETCIAWEQEAMKASELGLRVVCMRTGVVLSAAGGALAKMLPPFEMGLGGPVAGGRQYVSWIHLSDLARMIVSAVADERWSGPVNGTAPNPVTNGELSKALAAVLHRPAVLPVPALALRLLYGQMAEIVTTGQRVLPAKALILGCEFEHPSLAEALRSALS